MVALLAYVKSSVVGASVQLLAAAVALTLTFVLSLFFYGSLYYSYIPPAYYELPLHFVQRPPSAAAASEQQQRLYAPTPTDTATVAAAAAAAAAAAVVGGSSSSRPGGSSGAPLVAELDAFVGVGSSSSGTGLLPLFTPGHMYSVTVELQLPESDGNVALGSFSLSARSYDARGEPLQAAARTLRLRYRSWLLRTIDTLAFAPLYLFGEREQKQTLTVELFDEYRENGYRPTVRLVLELSDGRVELYGAALRVRVSFVGLRYWMFHWPLLSAVVGVASFESFLLIVLVSSWLARSRCRRRAIAMPADTQIASATNLPEVGDAQSVSSQRSLPSADVVPAANSVDCVDEDPTLEDCCDGNCDSGDCGPPHRGATEGSSVAFGGGSGSSELRRRQLQHSS